MKWCFLFVIVAMTFVSCKGRTDSDSHGAQIKQLEGSEYAFSTMSQEKGMKVAFQQYMDSNATLLRPDHNLITGKDAFDYLKRQNDSSFTLTWAPSDIQVSEAEDLGYTYGIYTLKEKDTILRGTYVTVWKKQKDGSWKFVLDTGNPGLGKK